MKRPKDGCGPNSWDTGTGDPFYSACKKHDEAYLVADLDQHQADQDLIQAMQDRIQREVRPYKQFALAVRAAIYTTIVTGLGFIWAKYL